MVCGVGWGQGQGRSDSQDKNHQTIFLFFCFFSILFFSAALSDSRHVYCWGTKVNTFNIINQPNAEIELLILLSIMDHRCTCTHAYTHTCMFSNCLLYQDFHCSSHTKVAMFNWSLVPAYVVLRRGKQEIGSVSFPSAKLQLLIEHMLPPSIVPH